MNAGLITDFLPLKTCNPVYKILNSQSLTNRLVSLDGGRITITVSLEESTNEIWN